jgi:cytochrome b
VRVFHWSLVLSFACAWLSANSLEALHMWAGYAAAALILARLGWGWLGTPYARFSQFVRPPAAVAAYLAAILRGSEARHIGHNPVGGAMVFALFAAVVATAFTGWLLMTDALWGVQWAQDLHALVAHGLLLLVLLHMAGVALASFRHRENLVAAMITGWKRRPEPGDIA